MENGLKKKKELRIGKDLFDAVWNKDADGKQKKLSTLLRMTTAIIIEKISIMHFLQESLQEQVTV